MNIAPFEFWIVAVAAMWFALIAGIIVVVVPRIGKALDERHTRQWGGRE